MSKKNTNITDADRQAYQDMMNSNLTMLKSKAENIPAKNRPLVAAGLIIFLLYFLTHPLQIAPIFAFGIIVGFLVVNTKRRQDAKEKNFKLIDSLIIPNLEQRGYHNPQIFIDKDIRKDNMLELLGLAPKYFCCYENLEILTDEFVYSNFYTTKLEKRIRNGEDEYVEVTDFEGKIFGVNTGHYFYEPVRIIRANDKEIGNYYGRDKERGENIIDSSDSEFNKLFEVFARNIGEAEDALQDYIIQELKDYTKKYGQFSVCFYKQYVLFSFSNNCPDFSLACKKNGFKDVGDIDVINGLNEVLSKIKEIDSFINA